MEQGSPGSATGRFASLARFGRTYVWHRDIRAGLLVALPALIGFLGAQLSALAFDGDLAAVKALGARVERDIRTLDEATRTYEGYELLRASFALNIAASGGDRDLAFRLDQLHRASALHRLRQIAATLDPSTWKPGMAGYEATVMSDYRGGGGVARLQAFENALLARAKTHLVDAQALADDLAARRERLEGARARWERWLTMLGALATVVAFFARIDGARKEGASA